jgi:hypothetical protein
MGGSSLKMLELQQIPASHCSHQAQAERAIKLYRPVVKIDQLLMASEIR